MRNLIVHVVVVALSLALCDHLLDGVHVETMVALVVAAAILGLVNATVRPVLTFFTFPLTVVTLGLFYLVVNGTAFALAAFLVPGFSVRSFGQAVLGALIVSITSTVLGWVFGKDDERDRKRRRGKRD